MFLLQTTKYQRLFQIISETSWRCLTNSQNRHLDTAHYFPDAGSVSEMLFGAMTIPDYTLSRNNIYLQFYILIGHHLPAFLSVCPSLHLSISLSICLSLTVYVSVCPSIHSAFRLSIRMSVLPSVRPSIRLSVHLSIHLLVHPSVSQSIPVCLSSVCLSVCPSVCFFVCPSNCHLSICLLQTQC